MSFKKAIEVGRNELDQQMYELSDGNPRIEILFRIASFLSCMAFAGFACLLISAPVKWGLLAFLLKTLGFTLACSTMFSLSMIRDRNHLFDKEGGAS